MYPWEAGKDVNIKIDNPKNYFQRTHYYYPNIFSRVNPSITANYIL